MLSNPLFIFCRYPVVFVPPPGFGGMLLRVMADGGVWRHIWWQAVACFWAVSGSGGAVVLLR